MLLRLKPIEDLQKNMFLISVPIVSNSGPLAEINRLSGKTYFSSASQSFLISQPKLKSIESLQETCFSSASQSFLISLLRPKSTENLRNHTVLYCPVGIFCRRSLRNIVLSALVVVSTPKSLYCPHFARPAVQKCYTVVIFQWRLFEIVVLSAFFCGQLRKSIIKSLFFGAGSLKY